MKTTDNFKKIIKEYLDNRAANDELFAASYSKSGKNIDDCCAYILNSVQKSGCNGFSDDEIFGIAVHYYDEDNLKVVKAPNCRVVVNHEIELSDEDIRNAKEAALKRLQDEAYTSLKKRHAKTKKEDKGVQQMTLF